MADEEPRLLIHIPIVHSQADMGSSSDAVRQAYIDEKGSEAWEESRRAIADFWQKLEDRIGSLDLDFSKVRIYQDGLPVCGYERNIVEDLAASGGVNYRILLELMARGAALEGTENPDLLLKEYQLLKTGMAGPMADRNASVRAAEKLLEERDRFIARRIDQTLRPGETGLLFLGALHHATEMLPATIVVTSLDALAASGDG